MLARDFYSFHYPSRFYMIKDGYVSKVFFFSSAVTVILRPPFSSYHMKFYFIDVVSQLFCDARWCPNFDALFIFSPSLSLSLSLSHPSQFPVYSSCFLGRPQKFGLIFFLVLTVEVLSKKFLKNIFEYWESCHIKKKLIWFLRILK